MKWAVDVGHACGTGSFGFGVDEHAACAVIGEKLVALLREQGEEADLIDFAHMSNRDDLVATRKAIEAGGYDAAISLHCDNTPNKAARGAHVCYVSSGGKQLALAIAHPLCAFMPGRAERVQKRTDLYVLKAKGPRSVLVEVGFDSNEDDAAKIKGQPDKLAALICKGAMRWKAEQERR